MLTANFHMIMGTIGGFIAFFGFLPYIFQVVRKETKPNRASWLIWSVMGFLILVTYYATGSRNNLPGTIALAVGPAITMLLSLKYGESKFDTLDKGCLLGAVMSLLLWKGLHAPALGLLGALITDAMGVIPTWRDLLKNPAKEKPHAWVIWSIANVCNMFTIERMTIQDTLYPTYYLVGTGVSTYLVLRQYWVKGLSASKEVKIDVPRLEIVNTVTSDGPYRAAAVRETRPAKSRRVAFALVGIGVTVMGSIAWKLTHR